MTQLPNHFSRIKLCDGQTEHILDEELPQITNDYWVEQVVEILDTTTRYQVVSATDVGERSLAEVLILRTSSQALALNGFDPGLDDEDPGDEAPSYDPFNSALDQWEDGYQPEVSYYITDHLGNTRIVYHTLFEDCTPTGIQYQLEHVLDYYPYGKILREYVSGNSEKFLTTFHERDRETNLDYRGARYYDSDYGRFLSVDPLAADYAGWSPYNYVLGNPVMLVDPEGRSADDHIFVNLKGEEIHRIEDDNAITVTILPFQNGRYVLQWIFSRGFDPFWFGPTYDVPSFENFFADNRNDFFENSGPTFKNKDGTIPKNIPNERAIPLYTKDGIVTIGDNRPVSQGGERIVGDNPGQISEHKINAIRNSDQVGFLHTEPVNQLRSPYQFGGPKFGYEPKSYSPNPSAFDETHYKPQEGFHSVIVRPNEIVFFRSVTVYFRISKKSLK